MEEASLFLTWAATGGMAMDGERDEEGDGHPCDAHGVVTVFTHFFFSAGKSTHNLPFLLSDFIQHICTSYVAMN